MSYTQLDESGYIVNEDVLKVSFCEFIIYEHLYF